MPMLALAEQMYVKILQLGRECVRVDIGMAIARFVDPVHAEVVVNFVAGLGGILEQVCPRYPFQHGSVTANPDCFSQRQHYPDDVFALFTMSA